MAEFLLVFGVTFLVIIGVTAGLVFGKAPVYRPEAADIEQQFARLLEGQLSEQEWHFFLDMPIQHSSELEQLRQQCKSINDEHALRSRADKARLKEEGMIRIRHLLNRLESGGSKSF